MTKEEITILAMRDANTETDENLRAAADIYQRLINNQTGNPKTPGTHAPHQPVRPQG